MQHRDVLAVSTLADKTFGKGFLSINFISSILESDNYYAYSLKNNDDFIGFAIWEVVSTIEISKLFYLDLPFFSDYFKSSNFIAKLNQIAINEDYRNNGFGELLFKESVEKLPTEVDFLTSIYWLKDDSKVMRRLLIKNGFESIKIIPNYWYNNSLEKEYNCAICGIPPCECSAEVFSTKKPQKN